MSYKTEYYGKKYQTRLEWVRILSAIDNIYNDGGKASLERELDGHVAYTNMRTKEISINLSKVEDDTTLRALAHHEHGHIAFSVFPEDIKGNKIKGMFFNLLEDIRLEFIIGTFLPFVREKFIENNLRLIELSNTDTDPVSSLWFYLRVSLKRILRTTQDNLTLSDFSIDFIPSGIHGILSKLFEVLVLYSIFIKQSIAENESLVRSASLIDKAQNANEAYTELLKEVFNFIDNNEKPRQPLEFPGKIFKGNDDDAGVEDDSTEDTSNSDDSNSDDSTEDTSNSDDSNSDDSNSDDSTEDDNDSGITSGDGDSLVCGDVDDYVDLDSMADIMTQKLKNHAQEINNADTLENPEDIFDKVPGIQVTDVTVDDYLEKQGGKVPIPKEINKILTGGRRLSRTEKSNMRVPGAPMSGSGRKFLVQQEKRVDFTFELLIDTSSSVSTNLFDREVELSRVIFETFKNVADFRLTQFDREYYVIEENMKMFPANLKHNRQGATRMFQAIKHAVENIPSWRTYVCIAITDGKASFPSIRSGELRGRNENELSRSFLSFLQKKNRFVIIVPVKKLDQEYINLFGKYQLPAYKYDLNSLIDLSKLIKDLGKLIRELYEEI